MATVVYPSPIFGPIHSRRLGVSLGINLLPGDGKVCSFDCLYCECGLNRERVPHKPFPTRAEVREALEARLQDMLQNGPAPDVLTFAGNGEPTCHPEFAEIVNDTICLRDKYFPKAQVSVLSNSTYILRDSVFEALKRVDCNILKLDTVNQAYIQRVNCPRGHYDVDALVQRMKAFKGHCIIQTLFMKGTDFEGVSVDNTGDEYVLPWLETVKAIAPQKVMIYTIDRETPCPTLQKASHEELDKIKQLLIDNGIDASASY